MPLKTAACTQLIICILHFISLFLASSERRRKEHYERKCGYLEQPHVYQPNPRRDEQWIAILRVVAAFCALGAAVVQFLILSINAKIQPFLLEKLEQEIKDEKRRKKLERKKKKL